MISFSLNLADVAYHVEMTVALATEATVMRCAISY
jgi:hypothetical protein